jgi:hypothetical protein
MAIRFVELDYLNYGGEERLRGLVGDHVGLAVTTEAIPKEEEAVAITSRSGR